MSLIDTHTHATSILCTMIVILRGVSQRLYLIISVKHIYNLHVFTIYIQMTRQQLIRSIQVSKQMSKRVIM